MLGILAIGKNPQDFLLGAYVQFLRINGNEYADELAAAGHPEPEFDISDNFVRVTVKARGTEQ